MLEARMFSPPDQFVGDAEKSKKQWKEQNVDFFESLILFENRQLKTSYYNKVVNYNLKRGILNMSDVEYACDPYGVGVGTFPAKMEHKGLGNAKIDLLVGEHMKRKFDFRVCRSTSDQEGLREVEEQKTAKIYNELVSQVQAQAFDEKQMEKKLKSLNDYVRSPYFDVVESGGNKVLKYTYKYHNLKDKFDICFEDGLISAEQYMFTDCIGGELVIRRGDPLRIFALMDAYATDESGLEALCEVSYHTLSSLIDMFHDELSKEDLEKLKEMKGIATGAYPYFTWPQIGNVGELAIPTDSLTAKVQEFIPLGQEVESSLFNSYMDGRGNIRLLHTIWRSKRKIKILKYLDEKGVEHQRPVHEKYQPNEDLGEYIEKEEWINEWWKGYKIGYNIYVAVKPVPYLSTSLDNISKQTPPVTIQYYNTGSSKAQSLMDIVKPYDYLYDIFDYKRQMLVNLMLPDIIGFSTAMIPDNMTLEQYLNYILSTAFMPQDPTADVITPKGNQVAGNFNTTVSQRLSSTQQGPLAVLTQVMNDIKMTMDTVSGITQQRQGAITSNELVGNVERSVQQSSHTTERWFARNEYFKERVLKKVLDIQLNILRKNPTKLNYLMDDFTKAVLTDQELEGVMLADYNVLVSRSSDDAKLLEFIEAQFQAALQNGSGRVSDAIDLFKNESISDAMRIIRVREEEREIQQQAVQQQQAENQHQQAIMLAEIENKKLDLEYAKLAQDKYKVDRDNETKIIVEQMKSLAIDEGTSTPQIMDAAEQGLKLSELAHKQQVENNKAALEMKKLAQEQSENEKDRQVERENMQNDIMIEKLRIKNSNIKKKQSK